MFLGSPRFSCKSTPFECHRCPKFSPVNPGFLYEIKLPHNLRMYRRNALTVLYFCLYCFFSGYNFHENGGNVCLRPMSLLHECKADYFGRSPNIPKVPFTIPYSDQLYILHNGSLNTLDFGIGHAWHPHQPASKL